MEKKTVGIQFKDATKVRNGAASSRRGAPKLTVSPTGACRSNVEGKEMLQNFVKREGGDPSSFQLMYKGAEDEGLMGLYLAKGGGPGTMNVTLYSHSLAFHAGGCFDDFPLLRPGSKVDCHLEEVEDDKGTACISVHVKAGAVTRAVKRKKTAKAKPNPNPNPTPDGQTDAQPDDQEAQNE